MSTLIKLSGHASDGGWWQSMPRAYSALSVLTRTERRPSPAAKITWYTMLSIHNGALRGVETSSGRSIIDYPPRWRPLSAAVAGRRRSLSVDCESMLLSTSSRPSLDRRRCHRRCIQRRSMLCTGPTQHTHAANCGPQTTTST